jgi:hypothetical protein
MGQPDVVFTAQERFPAIGYNSRNKEFSGSWTIDISFFVMAYDVPKHS